VKVNVDGFSQQIKDTIVIEMMLTAFPSTPFSPAFAVSPAAMRIPIL
jgi:hypothetical protein